MIVRSDVRQLAVGLITMRGGIMIHKIKIAMGILSTLLLMAVVLLIATWATKPENWNVSTDASSGIVFGTMAATWITATLIFHRRR